MSPLRHYEPSEVAELLGLEPAWVERNARNFPHRRFGRFIRFSESDVAEISEMHAVRPADEPATAPEAPLALVDLKPGRAPRGRRADTA